MSHKVEAAYVTLRVPNELGQEVTLGFYSGAVLPKGANQEDLDRLVRKGMVSKVSAPASEPEPEPTPVPETEESPSRPPQNAPKAEWVTYAESQGFSHNEADAMSKADLIATFGG